MSVPGFDSVKQALWIPMRNGLVAAILMALVAVFLPNWYQSQVLILPPGGQSQNSIQGLAATLGLGLSGLGQDPTVNYGDILKSRWVGDQLLQETFDFHQRGWRFGRPEARHETLLHYLDAENLDRGMARLSNLISFRKDLKTGLITLSVETKSPDLSQRVAGRATELLNEFLTQKIQTSGTVKAQYATDRLREAEGEFDRAEKALKAFMEVNRSYQMSADPSVRLKGQRLEADLNQERQLLSTLSLNKEQALLDAKNDTPVLNILDSANLPIEKSRPVRSLMVITAFLVAMILSLAVRNWSWIKSRLSPAE